jgi:hypothetical protein
VFFLGLLSTPIPYLLLAAFYFFGFAMGMFNNSSGDEVSESISTITIPVETKAAPANQTAYYYQASSNPGYSHPDCLKSEENTSPFFPDTGSTILQFRNTQVHEFLFSGFQFSRPPPAGC